MKYYAVFLPMLDADKSKIHRDEHLKFLENLRDKDIVIINGRFTDGSGGLVIYKGESIDEIEGTVKEDPYIINGARDYEIHEWEMVSKYDFGE